MMETLSFDELHAYTNNLHLQQHYISTLQGSVHAGETVLLDEEVVLTDALRSKVAAIIRKDSPTCFLVNFYVLAGHHGIQVPRLPVPRKRTYVGFPNQEVLQTKCVSVVSEGRFRALAYLINEDNILSGRKAFCIGMPDCFFLRLRVYENLTLEPKRNATNVVHPVENLQSHHGGSQYKEPQLGVQTSQDHRFCGVGVALFFAMLCKSAGGKTGDCHTLS
jgi:hypothetical protein